MDKFYSKKALILKAVLCFMLGPLYMLLSLIPISDEWFVYLFISVFPIACLYTIPFWLTLRHLKIYPVKSIKPVLLRDLLFCFCPAVLGIIAGEIITVIINGATSADGFISLVFIVIYTIITAVFFFLYKFVYKR